MPVLGVCVLLLRGMRLQLPVSKERCSQACGQGPQYASLHEHHWGSPGTARRQPRGAWDICFAPPRTHAPTHTHTHTHMHDRTPAQTHTRTHTDTHTRTNARVRTPTSLWEGPTVDYGTGVCEINAHLPKLIASSPPSPQIQC
jgi:hypothetical protein